MTCSRREILKAAGVVASYSMLETTSTYAAGQPKLGLIFPPKDRGVPEEGLAMYGSDVEYLVEGLGLPSMTPEGYETVIDKIVPAAETLVTRGAEAIVLMGTSLSFYKGAAFNQKLTDSIHEATGLPAVTMSTGIIEGLKQVGARRVVAATAYNDEVNNRLVSFLGEHGFDVLSIKGLGMEAMSGPGRVTTSELIEFSASVYDTAPDADAIVVSCGGLRTLETLAPLEERCRVPAVSSTPHALLAGARLLGLSGKTLGYGSLLAMQ